jgi:hypothetical protein
MTMRTQTNGHKRNGIKIEKGIPLPNGISPLGRRGPRAKHPIRDMSVGDSFLLKSWSEVERITILTAARRNQVKVATRTVDGGLRVWRIA